MPIGYGCSDPVKIWGFRHKLPLRYRDRRNTCMSFVKTKAEPSTAPAVAVAPLFTPVACCPTGSA